MELKYLSEIPIVLKQRTRGFSVTFVHYLTRISNRFSTRLTGKIDWRFEFSVSLKSASLSIWSAQLGQRPSESRVSD